MTEVSPMTIDHSLRCMRAGKNFLSVFVCGLVVFCGAAAADTANKLYQAAGAGDMTAVEQLISEGADVNGKSSEGSQALNAAAASNHHNVIKLLLKHGADPNVLNKEGDTPMICATKYAGGNPKTVKLLLGAGPDLSIADNDGKTALDYAKQYNQSEAVALLQKAK
jgi:ankyrin repeat protein